MNRPRPPLILPIQILNVRVFLIQTSTGWILVDAGLPLLYNQLIRSIQASGVDPAGIQAIILTHGHLDHIGCLAYLKELSSAQVICHRSLAPALESGSCEEAVPQAPLWKLINQPVHRLLGSRLKPVYPDLIFTERLDLDVIGLSGHLLHTPGHSPGSTSILLDSGVCLIGDLLREPSPGHFDTGLFYLDKGKIFTSLQKVASSNPSLIYLSHGTTLTGEDLKQFLSENRPR